MGGKTEYLRVRNWKKFQHYKDRTPPWIKLHWELFSSEDWVMLADASKLLAVVCMMVASRNEGMVPNNPDYLKRVAYLDKRPDLTPLIECGFLENPQADDSEPEQTQADAIPEAEAYTEDTDKKDTPPTPPQGGGTSSRSRKGRKKAREYDAEFLAWWEKYPKREAKGDAFDAYWAMRDGGHSHATLVAGAAWAAKKYADTEDQFIPLPATFLRRESFLAATEGTGNREPPEPPEGFDPVEWYANRMWENGTTQH